MNSWPKTENWHHLLTLSRLSKINIFLTVELNGNSQSPKMTKKVVPITCVLYVMSSDYYSHIIAFVKNGPNFKYAHEEASH